MDNIVAIIPARSGSKGVVDKNIHMVGGYPLMAYSIQCALKSTKIDRVIVSTDSEKYASIAKDFSAEIPFLRPAALASDTATDYDVLKHLLDWLLDEESYRSSYCVYLRPTTPLRDPACVDEAIDRVINDAQVSALRSVHKMPESAYKVTEIDGGLLKPLPIDGLTLEKINAARQTFPDTYQPNGYVDIFRSDIILNQKKLFDDQVVGWETESVIEVDCLYDIDFLEFQIAKYGQKVKELFS